MRTTGNALKNWAVAQAQDSPAAGSKNQITTYMANATRLAGASALLMSSIIFQLPSASPG